MSRHLLPRPLPAALQFLFLCAAAPALAGAEVRRPDGTNFPFWALGGSSLSGGRGGLVAPLVGAGVFTAVVIFVAALIDALRGRLLAKLTPRRIRA